VEQQPLQASSSAAAAAAAAAASAAAVGADAAAAYRQSASVARLVPRVFPGRRARALPGLSRDMECLEAAVHPNDARVVRRVLAFMEEALGARPADLRLSRAFPSAGAGGLEPSPAAAYLRSLGAAGAAPSTALRHAEALGRASEAFLARMEPSGGMGPTWAVMDAPSARGLVRLEGELRQEARPALRGRFGELADPAAFRAVLAGLRSRAAVASRRRPAARAWSQQAFLALATLQHVPAREAGQLLGGLQIGSTLRYDAAAGRWAVWRSVNDVQRGLRPLGFLGEELAADVLDFCERGRRHLGAPQHAHLFCSRDGEPLSAAGLGRLLSQAAAKPAGARRVTADSLVSGLLKDVSPAPAGL